MSEDKLKILCVDDEPRVLEGLQRNLHTRYAVLTASSGAEGLDRIHENRDLAIILSDMRMPEMDGAVFLRHARNLLPNAVRILLTGHADINAAIKAINEGQIFRFLTKPCAPNHLLAVLEEAKRQYELITAEKVLLQQTLLGCIKALVDVMSLSSPMVIGRAARLKRKVTAFARELDLDNRWQVEAAAMLSQLGSLSLPAGMVQKLHAGQELAESEQQRVLDAMVAANRLIAHIPRLQPVSEILDDVYGLYKKEPGAADAARHAELLRLAIDLDRLETQGQQPKSAYEIVRSTGEYPEELMKAVARALDNLGQTSRTQEVPPQALEIGMVLNEDLKTRRGMLIAPRGCEVTASFLEHIRQYADELDKPTIAVSHGAPAQRRVDDSLRAAASQTAGVATPQQPNALATVAPTNRQRVLKTPRR